MSSWLDVSGDWSNTLLTSTETDPTTPVKSDTPTVEAEEENHTTQEDTKSCRGVYFDHIRHLWRANWPEETVILDRESKRPVDVRRCTRTKGFSAKKFGFEESKEMAIAHRKAMITTGIIRKFVFADEPERGRTKREIPTAGRAKRPKRARIPIEEAPRQNKEENSTSGGSSPCLDILLCLQNNQTEDQVIPPAAPSNGSSVAYDFTFL